MSLRAAIVAQFRKPHGIVGAIIGQVMASRPSNVDRSRWTVGLLEPTPDDRVLEVGCGPGIALAACLDKVTSGIVVGVDHSAVMVAQAAKRNAAAIGGGRLTLLTCDLERLPDLETRFTKALMVNVAQFLPDMAAGFSAIAKVLAPGALFAVTQQPRNPKPTVRDTERAAADIGAALVAAGYVDLRIETLALKPAPAACVLGKTPV